MRTYNFNNRQAAYDYRGEGMLRLHRNPTLHLPKGVYVKVTTKKVKVKILQVDGAYAS